MQSSKFKDVFNIKHNYVLVEVAGAYITKVGTLLVDSSYHKEKAANVYGVVRQVPERLLYFKKEIDAIKNEYGGAINCPVDRVEEIQELHRLSMSHDTDMEVMVGDTIIFKYNAYLTAYKEGRVFKEDSHLLLLVPYDMILIVMRGDDIVPVNGQVIVTAVTKKYEGKIILEGDIEIAQLGKIEYIGSPLRGYLGSDDTDDDYYQKNDTVVFKKSMNVLLEEQVFRQLDKPFYRLQRRHLLGKVTFN